MTAAALPRPLRHYLEFARIGFINILAFRLRYYTGIVTYLINVTVYYFIWKALYASDPHFAEGFDFAEMTTYVAVGWVIRSVYFNNIDSEIASDVQSGDVVMSMLKPTGVQVRYLGQAVGEAAFRLILLTTPAALLVSLIFPVRGPASLGHLGAFFVALAGAVMLTGALNFIVGALALRLKAILGLLRAKFYVQELLSGLLVPLTMFPPALAKMMAWLPFQHIAYTPLRIYLGKLNGAELGEALVIQWAWVAALLLFGAWFWERMARKVTVHGG
ncbi:MAG: ABC-2 family transporter protein [Acidobacteria bacterium]|nr:ABC-2 family transporter protein [Acidobacteriota bacterium]